MDIDMNNIKEKIKDYITKGLRITILALLCIGIYYFLVFLGVISPIF